MRNQLNCNWLPPPVSPPIVDERHRTSWSPVQTGVMDQPGLDEGNRPRCHTPSPSVPTHNDDKWTQIPVLSRNCRRRSLKRLRYEQNSVRCLREPITPPRAKGQSDSSGNRSERRVNHVFVMTKRTTRLFLWSVRRKDDVASLRV